MTMRSPGRAGIALDDAPLDGVAECPDALADAFLAAFVTLTFFAVAFFAGAFLAGIRRLLKLAVPVRLRPSSGERRKQAPGSSAQETAGTPFGTVPRHNRQTTPSGAAGTLGGRIAMEPGTRAKMVARYTEGPRVFAEALEGST